MTDAEVREHLSVLAETHHSVVLEAIGVAAVETKEARAYKALRDAGVSVLRRHESELLCMIDAGSPAAIVYAALLLRIYDAHDPRLLLERFAHDQRECTIHPGGCCAIPGNQLQDAVAQVCAGGWVSPSRTIRTRLRRIQRALWFELPSMAELNHARRADRSDSLVDEEAWTFAFAELLVAPKCAWALASERPAVEALLGDETSEVRLYAAALLRAIEPPAGVALLQRLQHDPSLVPLCPRLGFVPRSAPMAKLARQVLDWPGWMTVRTFRG